MMIKVHPINTKMYIRRIQNSGYTLASLQEDNLYLKYFNIIPSLVPFAKSRAPLTHFNGYTFLETIQIGPRYSS